jgi:hypothetical protein
MNKGHFVEEKGQFWRSSFSKQTRPDQDARTAQVLPKNRLVRKGARYFSTDTSKTHLKEVMERDTEVDTNPAPIVPPKKKFSAKNN